MDGDRGVFRFQAANRAYTELLIDQVRGVKKQEQVRGKVAQHNALVAAQSAPASRGERFAPIPTLAYRITPQGQLFALEREAVLEAVELDLLTPEAVQLPGFQTTPESQEAINSLVQVARMEAAPVWWEGAEKKK